MKYKLWYERDNEAYWSVLKTREFTDLLTAQAACEKACLEAFEDCYFVAAVNPDNTPNFGPFGDEMSNDEWAFGGELDTSIPYTLTSALDFLPPVSESPDAKRFVDIADLRSAANAVTKHVHEWRVAQTRVHVSNGIVGVNGNAQSKDEVRALIFALQGALDAVS